MEPLDPLTLRIAAALREHCFDEELGVLRIYCGDEQHVFLAERIADLFEPEDEFYDDDRDSQTYDSYVTRYRLRSCR